MIQKCPLLVVLAIFLCGMNGLRIVNLFNHHLLETRDKFSAAFEKTDDVENIRQSVILIGAQKGVSPTLPFFFRSRWILLTSFPYHHS